MKFYDLHKMDKTGHHHLEKISHTKKKQLTHCSISHMGFNKDDKVEGRGS